MYDSDAYNDDLPFWNTEHGKPHLVIPYALDTNDMRFATPQGFNTGDQFFTYLRDTLDFLLEVKRAQRSVTVVYLSFFPHGFGSACLGGGKRR